MLSLDIYFLLSANVSYHLKITKQLCERVFSSTIYHIFIASVKFKECKYQN